MKILGVGLALVDQKKWIKKSVRFLAKHFSELEMKYCSGKRKPWIHYSARWACKEAFLQALGAGETVLNRMKQVEVLTDSNGIPQVNVQADVLDVQKKWKIREIKASLSHSDHYSIAQVIILGEVR